MPSTPPASSRRQLRLTERDRRILEFAAEHRLVLEVQVQALLGVSAGSAATRLRALAAAGFITRRHLLHGQPASHQVTRRGIRAIGGASTPPRVDLSTYAHDVGVAWLWLAARSGAFGGLHAVIGERRMRSLDAAWVLGDRARPPLQRDDAERTRGSEHPLGVRLGGLGPRGRERLHYPDLTLVTPRMTRIAIELELTTKGKPRRERILAAYAADRRIEAVLYLVGDRGVARAIQNSVRALGLGDLVGVQLAELAPRSRGSIRAARTLERSLHPSRPALEAAERSFHPSRPALEAAERSLHPSRALEAAERSFHPSRPALEAVERVR